MQHRFNNDVLASNAHQCQFESSNPENPDSDNNYGHASHKYQQNLATYVKLNLTISIYALDRLAGTRRNLG